MLICMLQSISFGFLLIQFDSIQFTFFFIIVISVSGIG